MQKPQDDPIETPAHSGSAAGVSRRALLAGVAGLGLAPGLAGCGPTSEVASPGDRLARDVREVLDRAAQQVIEADPEAVTRLGLAGRGAPAWALTRLSSRSQAGFERTRLDRIETLQSLSSLPLAGPQSRLRAHQLAIHGAFERAVALQAYGFGRVALDSAQPYVADHLGGSYLDVPRLLLSRQPVRSPDDTDAYLQRLAALPATIRDERRRLEADAAAGAIPPRTVLSRLAAKARALADVPVEGHPLLKDLANRTVAVSGLSDEARQSTLVAASRILAGPMAGAYADLAASAGTLFESASDLPGLSAMAEGPAYFDTALRTSLLVEANPEDLIADIEVRARTAQRELGASMDALAVPDSDLQTRRAALLEAVADPELTAIGLTDALTERMDTLRPRLRQIMARLPDADAVVTLSPAALWAPYDHDDMTYEPAAADGTLSGTLRVRPGLEAFGTSALETVLYREGIPGRHLARAAAIEDTGQPMLRHFCHPTTFQDAWAAYGLDLSEELSRSDDLAGQAFRRQADLDLAVEALVDLGIHGLGWTSERALEALRTRAGMSNRASVDALWRIAVQPSRATAAVFGRSVFRALRTRAENQLGGDFDPAAFHYTLLTTGPRPFAQVQDEMEDWASAQVG
ncbi:MAG: DUF885 family protein [Pseudomonadota bacterium]